MTSKQLEINVKPAPGVQPRYSDLINVEGGFWFARDVASLVEQIWVAPRRATHFHSPFHEQLRPLVHQEAVSYISQQTVPRDTIERLALEGLLGRLPTFAVPLTPSRVLARRGSFVLTVLGSVLSGVITGVILHHLFKKPSTRIVIVPVDGSGSLGQGWTNAPSKDPDDAVEEISTTVFITKSGVETELVTQLAFQEDATHLPAMIEHMSGGEMLVEYSLPDAIIRLRKEVRERFQGGENSEGA